MALEVVIPPTVLADDQPEGVEAIVAEPFTATQRISKLPAALVSEVPKVGEEVPPDEPVTTVPIVPTNAKAIINQPS
jgi:hypothetical protein